MQEMRWFTRQKQAAHQTDGRLYQGEIFLIGFLHRFLPAIY
jgi:hypothetical protein